MKPSKIFQFDLYHPRFLYLFGYEVYDRTCPGQIFNLIPAFA